MLQATHILKSNNNNTNTVFFHKLPFTHISGGNAYVWKDKDQRDISLITLSKGLIQSHGIEKI